MSATLAPLPPPIIAPAPNRGGAPARRAIRRWAWRLLRREWRQQVVILGLLIVAVAGTTVGLGFVVNVEGTAQALFGTADARLDIGPPGPGGVATDLAATRQRFGAAEAIAHAERAGTGIDHAGGPTCSGSARRVQRAHAAPGLRSLPRRRRASGRDRCGRDDVRSEDGSQWSVHGRALRVVGIVENPKDLEDAFGLVAAGQISSPSSLTLLFNARRRQVIAFKPPAGKVQGISSSSANSAQQRRNQALAVLVLATIGLTSPGCCRWPGSP